MRKEGKVVVVGGGVSGVLAAIHLCRAGFSVIVLEKDPQKIARGIAYQNDFTYQLLNVDARKMSLFPDSPLDFQDWLQHNSFQYRDLLSGDLTFVPRKIFGDYVAERLQEAHAEFGNKLEIQIEEAVGLTVEKDGYAVHTAGGKELKANHVVLALGNFPPGDLVSECDQAAFQQEYFSYPWTDTIYKDLRGDENIMLIGSGLTSVDVLLGFHRRGFTGAITMLSRNGRLPVAHSENSGVFVFDRDLKMTPGELFRYIRGQVKNNPGVSWITVIDSIRPHSQGIWLNWTLAERRVFLSRFRSFWEVSRHRLPPRSAAKVRELLSEGRLILCKGKFVSMARHTSAGVLVTFLSEGRTTTTRFDRVINCTGPESNYRKVRFPIIRNLMEQGLVVPDELGLGIRCTAQGKIIDKEGKEHDKLLCMGPMRKSALWETTALHEIRSQAIDLAKIINS